MRGLRPGPPTILAWVTAAMTLVTLLLSRTTGSGWLLVLVAGMVALLVVSLALPAVALARVELTVAGPPDATVGRRVAMEVSVRGGTGGVMLRLVRPTGDWVGAEGDGEGPVPAVPAHRGVVDHVETEVRSAAPFGLLWWRRRRKLPLARPMAVGPAPLDADAPPPSGRDRLGQVNDTLAHSTDQVRSIRDYVPGDPVRLVSWVASARHGHLLVKELEAPGQTPLTVVVDLRGDEEAVEQAASAAAGLADAALAVGMPVVLLTAEADGPRRGAVGSPVEVGRRLARAVPSAPPPPPAGGPDEMVVRVSAR